MSNGMCCFSWELPTSTEFFLSGGVLSLSGVWYELQMMVSPAKHERAQCLGGILVSLFLAPSANYVAWACLVIIIAEAWLKG